jgi:hypothetical protein
MILGVVMAFLLVLRERRERLVRVGWIITNRPGQVKAKSQIPDLSGLLDSPRGHD